MVKFIDRRILQKWSYKRDLSSNPWSIPSKQ
jgi:hypothetical protein